MPNNPITKRIFIAVTAAVFAAQGCANTGAQYSPIIDWQGVDRGKYQSDLSDCQAYAAKTAGAGQSAAFGAAIGALIGVALAAAGGVKNQRTEVGRVGALSGALGGAAQGETDQRNIIRNCLSGRGYHVLQ